MSVGSLSTYFRRSGLRSDDFCHFLVHPLSSLNVLETKSRIDRSVARIKARLEQWRAWCTTGEDPADIDKGLKRATTWVGLKSAEASKLINFKNSLNFCQQIALNYLESRAGKFSSLAGSVRHKSSNSTKFWSILSICGQVSPFLRHFMCIFLVSFLVALVALKYPFLCFSNHEIYIYNHFKFEIAQKVDQFFPPKKTPQQERAT